MQKTKLIIDTNIWVSYFMGKKIRAYLDKIIADERFDFYISQNGLDELQQVLSRSKFQKYITPVQIESLIVLLLRRCILVNVVTAVQLSRDAKDDFLLALSTTCQADYLLTGDEDLLVLKKVETTTIIKIADFNSLFYS